MIKKIYKLIFLVIVLILLSMTIVNLIFSEYYNKDNYISNGNALEKYKYHFVMIYNADEQQKWADVYESANEYAMSHDAYIDVLGEHFSDDYSKAKLLELALYSDVDGIIIEGDADEEVIQSINLANEKDIPVVTVMGDAEGSARDSFIGISSYDVGVMLAQKVLADLPEDAGTQDKGSLLILMQEGSEYSKQLTMYQTIIEMLSGRQLDIDTNLLESATQFSTDEAIRDILIDMKKEPDMIICLSEDITNSLYQGIVEYNKAGKIGVIGISSSKNIYKAVQKGIISGIVSVNTHMMGSYCAEALIEHKYTGYVSDYFMVDADLITPENVGEFINEEQE